MQWSNNLVTQTFLELLVKTKMDMPDYKQGETGRQEDRGITGQTENNYFTEPPYYTQI